MGQGFDALQLPGHTGYHRTEAPTYSLNGPAFHRPEPVTESGARRLPRRMDSHALQSYLQGYEHDAEPALGRGAVLIGLVMLAVVAFEATWAVVSHIDTMAHARSFSTVSTQEMREFSAARPAYRNCSGLCSGWRARSLRSPWAAGSSSWVPDQDSIIEKRAGS